MKKVLLGAVILILIFIGISFFLPKVVVVEQTITINKPVESVFVLVNDLKKWEKWSPLIRDDSTMVVSYPGPTVGVGAYNVWVSKDESASNVRLETTESIKNKLIVNKVEIEGFGEGENKWIFESLGNSTQVTWSFTTDFSKPIILGPWLGVLMKKAIGDEFEKVLKSLKVFAETDKEIPDKPIN